MIRKQIWIAAIALVMTTALLSCGKSEEEILKEKKACIEKCAGQLVALNAAYREKSAPCDELSRKALEQNGKCIELLRAGTDSAMEQIPDCQAKTSALSSESEACYKAVGEAPASPDCEKTCFPSE